MSGHLYYPEIMAPGVALLDYDNDGDLDVYVTQGQTLGTDPAVLQAAATRGALKDRLFRNDTVVNADGTRTIRFTDVTEQSRHRHPCVRHGRRRRRLRQRRLRRHLPHGLERRVLLHNNGDGTFTDVTKRAGVADPSGWGVSAAFFDYDRDGWLDLFVGNYLIYSIAGDVALPERDGTARLLSAEQLSRAAEPSVSQPRQRHVRGRHGKSAGSAARSARPWASRQPTSTTTAGSISTSPTTASRTSCGSTSTTARSETRRSLRARRSAAAGRLKPAWASTPATSTTTATRICSSPTGSIR